jgi:hypothetical protein
MATKKPTPSKTKGRAPIKKVSTRQPAAKKAPSKKAAKAAAKALRPDRQPNAAPAPILDLAELARRASLARLMRT